MFDGFDFRAAASHRAESPLARDAVQPREPSPRRWTSLLRRYRFVGGYWCHPPRQRQVWRLWWPVWRDID